MCTCFGIMCISLKLSTLKKIFIICFCGAGFLAQLARVRWLRASPKDVIKVLAGATVISRLHRERIRFQACACGCWQSLVPCLLSHWGPRSSVAVGRRPPSVSCQVGFSIKQLGTWWPSFLRVKRRSGRSQKWEEPDTVWASGRS